MSIHHLEKNYKTYFEWYKETYSKEKNKNNIFPAGISYEEFYYFVKMYLYKDDYILDTLSSQISNVCHHILLKHSFKYLIRYILKKEKVDSLMTYLDFYQAIYKHLIPKSYYVDSISVCQCMEEDLVYILDKYSIKFKFEKYLYKKFNK